MGFVGNKHSIGWLKEKSRPLQRVSAQTHRACPRTRAPPMAESVNNHQNPISQTYFARTLHLFELLSMLLGSSILPPHKIVCRKMKLNLGDMKNVHQHREHYEHQWF